jgi:hypothetical protein
MRAAFVIVALTAAALVAAFPAAAKNGIKATLTTYVPVTASAGTKLKVGWTLSYAEGGRRHLFGAGGVFIRLVCPDRTVTTTGNARGHDGRYTAFVRVPAGGIGRIRIGIHARTDSGPVDTYFPITNDPLKR